MVFMHLLSPEKSSVFNMWLKEPHIKKEGSISKLALKPTLSKSKHTVHMFLLMLTNKTEL
jgi:hypothetical protein